MGRREIEAGKAYWLLTLKDRTSGAFRQVQAKLRAFGEVSLRVGAAITATGVASAYALGRMVKAAIQADPRRFTGLIRETVRLEGAWRRLGIAVTSALAPAIIKLERWLTNVTKGLTEFVRRNPGAVESIAKIGVAITAAGIGLMAFGALIKYVLVPAIIILGAIIPRVLNPLTLYFAGMAALAYYILDAGRAVKALAGDTSDAFKDMTAGYDLLVKAIMSGRLEKAWKIVTLTMTLAFKDFTKSVRDMWDEITTYIAKWATSFAGVFNIIPVKTAKEMMGELDAMRTDSSKAITDEIASLRASLAAIDGDIRQRSFKDYGLKSPALGTFSAPVAKVTLSARTSTEDKILAEAKKTNEHLNEIRRRRGMPPLEFAP